MKYILICLSFYLAFYFLSAVDPFNIHRQHDDQEMNPKFRPWFEARRKNHTEISPILPDAMPLLELHPTDGNTTKSSRLLQMLTAKPHHSSSAGNFFQRQLRALFGHRHEKHPSATRSYIKTGLR